MLENLPDVLGHALRNQRAGLEHIVFNLVGLGHGTAALQLSSLAFADHAPIPAQYTADGEGMSPPIEWLGVPAATAALLLIVEDADAPTPNPLVHAIVVDLPVGDGALPEGALKSSGNEGLGYHTGRNSYLQAAWLPPDPPPGHGVHRYVFQLFALDADPGFSDTPGREAIVEAIREHGLASGCLTGTYLRPDGSISVDDAAPVTVNRPLA